MPNSEYDPASRVLLVEGFDDMHVVKHIRIRASIPEFTINVKDGKDELLKSIRYEAEVENRVALGIMLDANGNPAGRLQAVVDQLKVADIELPPDTLGEGTATQNDPTSSIPRVGVWIMPDNQSPGELENFLEEMIPAGDPVWPLAQGYIDGIPEEHRKFQEGKRLRAQVHAWLATRERPRPPGLAIGALDLAVDGPLCVRFAAWLRRLFAEP